MFRTARFLLLFLLILFAIGNYVSAQDSVQIENSISAQCGDIIEGEFTSNFQEFPYLIDLNAGDSLNISVKSKGKGLKTGLMISGPTNLGIAISNGEVGPDTFNNYKGQKPSANPKLASSDLSSNGSYTIRIVNFEFLYYYYDAGNYVNLAGSGGIGSYTLYIGCVKDGDTIQPGDTPPNPQPQPSTDIVNNSEALPTFSGNGFPGLAPVDFSSAFKVSLNLDAPNEGEIPATGNNVLGFKFKVNTGDKMNLSFTRTSGNLNLGLVVLSPNNEVIYMAALVNSETMSTLFSLPDAGEYIIGIFRLDLLPPSTPANTSFQLQASLNS